MARIDIGERLGRMLGVRIGDASYMTSLPVDIGHEPDFEDGVQLRPGPEDGQVTAGYLLRDEDPGDYFRDADGRGSLRVFTDQADRDDWIAQCEEAGDIPLVVDRYAHGAEHWSVANTRDYPDRRWDVAPCGGFIGREAALEALKAEMPSQDMQEPVP